MKPDLLADALTRALDREAEREIDNLGGRAKRKEAERAIAIGRERERWLIEEAEGAARLARWKRWQLEKLDRTG